MYIIYICIYIYTQIFIYTYMCTCRYILVCVFVYLYVYIYIVIHTGRCICRPGSPMSAPPCARPRDLEAEQTAEACAKRSDDLLGLVLVLGVQRRYMGSLYKGPLALHKEFCHGSHRHGITNRAAMVTVILLAGHEPRSEPRSTFLVSQKDVDPCIRSPSVIWPYHRSY